MGEATSENTTSGVHEVKYNSILNGKRKMFWLFNAQITHFIAFFKQNLANVAQLALKLTCNVNDNVIATSYDVNAYHYIVNNVMNHKQHKLCAKITQNMQQRHY